MDIDAVLLPITLEQEAVMIKYTDCMYSA
jgi:hypothetical protein